MKGLVYEDWTESGYSSSNSDLTPRESDQPDGRQLDRDHGRLQDHQQSNYPDHLRSQAGMPDDESIRHAIRSAQDNGLKVILKPQLW